MANYPRRIRQSLARPDVRRNPLNALRKRLWWKLRWRLASSLWSLSLNNGMRIQVARGGVGALIYYLGETEPDTARFFARYLKPGMVVFDIGAHFGEYTLRAADRIGPAGRVYAFEPNPAIFGALQRNVAINRLNNVTLLQSAVSDQDAEVEFEVHAEPAYSALPADSQPAHRRDTRERVRVPGVRLDTHWCALGEPRVDLVKIDVEGAEYLVFSGAECLLAQPADRAPVIVFEFCLDTYASFGFTGRDVLDRVEAAGYAVSYLTGSVPQPVSSDTIVAQYDGTVNLLAAKDFEKLAVQLSLEAGP